MRVLKQVGEDIKFFLVVTDSGWLLDKDRVPFGDTIALFDGVNTNQEGCRQKVFGTLRYHSPPCRSRFSRQPVTTTSLVHKTRFHSPTRNFDRLDSRVMADTTAPQSIEGGSKMSSLSRRACYKCGNVGHYAEVCSSSERLCYNCKQPGETYLMRTSSGNA